jgi:hypothetical protein
LIIDGEDDVLGLEIPVDDLVLVRSRQPVGDGSADHHRGSPVVPTSSNHLAEGLSHE